MECVSLEYLVYSKNYVMKKIDSNKKKKKTRQLFLAGAVVGGRIKRQEKISETKKLSDPL